MKNRESLYFTSAKISGIHFKIFSTRKGIRKIFLNKKEAGIKGLEATKLQPDDPYMFGVYNELSEYFDGKRKTFSVPLDISGTNFQLRVWNELLKIPYGKTISYKQLAERLNVPDAFRAVGKANGSNPIAIIIPCHRVINSNGKLGGYAAGLSIKERLLELEGSLSLGLFD